MSGKLDLKKTVSELVSEYPQVKDIMEELGFKDIVKPVALSTVGKMMTIPQGASIRGIPLNEVLAAFQARGFEIEGGETAPAASAGSSRPASAPAAGSSEARAELLKSYVTRLSAGENLEAVREDFVRNFKSVDAGEIAKAEQALIQGGTKVADVQRLCDVHSALFHGATREEQIASAEAAVIHALHTPAGEPATRDFSKIPGHPVNVFQAENQQIATRIADVKAAVNDGADVKTLMEKTEALRAVTVH